jgi:hypothetical protein
MSQGLMHSSYSEADTSSMESTPCDSFHIPQYEMNDYQSPLPTSPFPSPPDVEHSEKRHNPYLSSSVSMRSVSSNVANEHLSKRPSSLPVFRQSGLYFSNINFIK